jgi:hypothetical protein
MIRAFAHFISLESELAKLLSINGITKKQAQANFETFFDTLLKD